MKVLITGAKGLLGRELTKAAKKRKWKVDAQGSDTLDVTDPDAVDDHIYDTEPDVVIHCAAMTDVDECEEDAPEAEIVNAEGTANVARAAAGVNALLVFISTDYVFDGEGGAPYTEEDETGPLQVYGRTKLAGERAVAISSAPVHVVRTAWLFGPTGKNFISKLPALLKKGGEISAVNDQWGSPTYAPDLADAICTLIESDAKPGTWHIANFGHATFYDIVKEAVTVTKSKTKAKAVPKRKLPWNAKRPDDTRLDTSKWANEGFEPLRDWQDALAEFLKA